LSQTAAPRDLLGDDDTVVRDPDLAGSLSACAGWIRAAAGGRRASVRVAMSTPDGRLRVVASEGRQEPAGRLRSSRRRQVFESGSPLHIDLTRPTGTSLVILPLVSEGEALGIVEVIGPTEVLRKRDDALIAIVGQSAVVLRGVRLRAATDRALRATSAMLGLASDLLGAETATQAVRMTVDACHAHLGTPVVGALPDRDGWGWFLAASRGFGSRKRAEMRRAFRDSPNVSRTTHTRTSALRRQFRATARSKTVHHVAAGDAVLLLAGDQRQHRKFLATAGSLLGEALGHLALEGSVNPREADLGIAWAAHELKGPITAAAAAISHVTESSPAGSTDLLERTRDELRQSAELIDPLLRWSSGRAPLRLRTVDLVEVTHDAVASCSFDDAADRVRVRAPSRLEVRIDPGQLRVAIANLVRNALRYSPRGLPVNVVVGERSGVATISVRDRGPGIDASERQRIFDPLTRGVAGSDVRGGSGLGLFIARRIVEAHGGRIEAQPVRTGANFAIRLPLTIQRKMP
jgi:signal transduction histidine kinase